MAQQGARAMDELIKYMKALVFLQVQSLSGSSSFSKPEMLLHKAGFKNREIAEILGKKEQAVQKSILRVKHGNKEATDE
jgi:hypothetical protein